MTDDDAPPIRADRLYLMGSGPTNCAGDGVDEDDGGENGDTDASKDYRRLSASVGDRLRHDA
jgi:hypothetical protein